MILLHYKGNIIISCTCSLFAFAKYISKTFLLVLFPHVILNKTLKYLLRSWKRVQQVLTHNLHILSSLSFYEYYVVNEDTVNLWKTNKESWTAKGLRQWRYGAAQIVNEDNENVIGLTVKCTRFFCIEHTKKPCWDKLTLLLALWFSYNMVICLPCIL